jgi:acyl-CoA thioester hydrolase
VSRDPFRSRQAYPHAHPISTRWADNDVYGHVNNVVYYGWFDTAVNAWLIGQGLLDPGKSEVIGLVVETGCRYARPLVFPQQIEVGLAVTHVGTSSVRYALGIFGDDIADAAAEGFFVHVYVDHASRRPVPLPQPLREALEGLKLR